MIRFASILFIVLLGATLFAQAPDTLWTKTFGGADIDMGYSVEQTLDDGYIIAGYTGSFGFGGDDVWLIKTDANGDTLWTKTFDGGGGIHDYGYSVQEASDGYIITGITHKVIFPEWTGGVWLIKADANGDTLWTKAFGSSGSRGHCVQQTIDNGYIIVGNDGIQPGLYDVWLIKTDANGDTLWTKTFGRDSADVGYSIQETFDGGYVVTGYTESFGAGGADVWLIKTDTNGDTLWTKTYGGSADEGGYSVQQTGDGGYMITGYTYSFGAGESDVWIIRTNANGDTLWTKTFGGDSADVGYSAAEGIITGWTRSFGAGGDDVWIISLDTNGDILWSKTVGGIYDDRGYSIQQIIDGGYIIAGSTESFGAGNSDVWLIKVAPDGTTIVETPRPSIKDYRLRQNYPNPFNPITTIEFSLPQSSFVTLKVYNILGEEVATLVSERLAAGEYQYEWDAGNLASGVYLYKIQAGDYVEVKKMILLR